MELKEELASAKNENKLYKDYLEGVNAEKVALDQMLVETLKSSLTAKKDLIIKDEKLKKLESELEALKKELEGLKNSKSVVSESDIIP